MPQGMMRGNAVTMTSAVEARKLPVVGEAGFFSIRMESIGGLGAHVAGQILAEAGIIRQGLNGTNFSSYGSEKKGSPVKAYIHFCSPEQEVRTSSPVDSSHLVAIFHETLIKTEPVILGFLARGTVIVNTSRSAREAWDGLPPPLE